MASSQATAPYPPRDWRNPKTWQHRRPGHVLPFRVPFFRIFYSTTYTVLFIIELVFLAFTPASIIWRSIEQSALQYVIMVGGVYLLTAIVALFVYSSRIWSSRRALAEVGKPYIPVEEGEIGRSVRRMIKGQLERSAIVSWESRPRDLEGEILRAEHAGALPEETQSMASERESYTVGTIIKVDPAYPPWGRVMHPGWSSPSHRKDNPNPHVHFTTVFEELPNLIEAKAVSLAPPDPLATPAVDGTALADIDVLGALQRRETLGMRDYLTQLSYLGLVNPQELGHVFLSQYEKARFSGLPMSEDDFDNLMTTFAHLLDGMVGLAPEIIEQIRFQARDVEWPEGSFAPQLPPIGSNEMPTGAQGPSESASETGSMIHHWSPSRDASTAATPVTAPSRLRTPYLGTGRASQDSLRPSVASRNSIMPGMASRSSLGSVLQTPAQWASQIDHEYLTSNREDRDRDASFLADRRDHEAADEGSVRAPSVALTGEESLRSLSETSLPISTT